MYQRTIVVLSLFVFVAGMVGCNGLTTRQKGTIIGATAGGVLGEAIDDDGEEGLVIGAIAGGIAGYAIGQHMEPTDQQRMVEALEHGRANETLTWTNPNNGRRFAMTPGPSYRNEKNQTCRDFTLETTIRGETKTFYKTGCRIEPSGKWNIVDRPSHQSATRDSEKQQPAKPKAKDHEPRSSHHHTTIVVIPSHKPPPPCRAGVGPPPWAPAHGYRAKCQYRYYPRLEVYFSIGRKLYFWRQQGSWVYGPQLPARFDLEGKEAVRLALKTKAPFERHKLVQRRYGPSGR